MDTNKINNKSIVVVAVLLIAVAIVGFVIFTNSSTFKSAERDCAKVNITDDNDNGLYDINNVNELQCIESSDRDYELRSDIDASQTKEWDGGFIPIGSGTPSYDYDDENQINEYAFNGRLLGNGYEINNINYKDESGLFSEIGDDGIVKDIEFNNVNGNVTNYTGGVVARTSDGDIRNVNISGSITIGDSAGTFGGVVGNLGSSTVNYERSGTIENVNVSLDINSNGKTGSLIGGIVGDIYTDESEVRNAKYTGNINVSSSSVGGIAGRNSFGSTIDRVEVESSIKGSDRVGGVTGYLTEGTISNAIVKGDISGNERVGGISSTTFGGNLDRVLYIGTIEGDNEYGSIVGEVGYTTGTVGLYQVSDTESFGAVALDQDEPRSNAVSESDINGDSAKDTLEEFDFDFIWSTTDKYPTIKR